MMVLAISAAVMTGCGNSGVSEKKLKEILPDTITSYEYGDMFNTQEVKDIEITKADVNDGYEYAECEITLKDDYIERVVYAGISLTKYETGGWMVDYWEPLAEETLISAAAPDEYEIDEYVNGFGFSGITLEDTYDDEAEYGYCSRTYSVNESHEFVDFSGTVTVDSELMIDSAGSDWYASYTWVNSAEYSDMTADWKVEGLWTGTETNPVFGRPDKYELRIDSIDEDGRVNGDGKYYWPAFDGSEYLGKYGNYGLISATAYFEGDSPADAKLTISANCGNDGFDMIFEPDALRVTSSNLMGGQEFDYSRS